MGLARLGYSVPLKSDDRRGARALTTGRPWAFEALYRLYFEQVRDFCRRRLVNSADAEDAAHEAFLKAWGASARFLPGERIWPWLATIAANVCTDMNRRRERMVPHDEEDRPALDSTEEEAFRRLRIGIVREAVAQLPQRYRSHVYMRDYDGWSYEAMARFSGTTVSSVKSTLMRARRALETSLRKIAKSRGIWPLPALTPVMRPGLLLRLRRRVAALRGRTTWLGARSCAPGSWETPVATVLIATVVATAGLLIGSSPIARDSGPGKEARGPASSRVTIYSGDKQARTSIVKAGVTAPAANSNSSPIRLTAAIHRSSDGKRTTLRGKISARLGDDYSNQDAVLDIYCDAGLAAATACAAVDAVPST